MNWLIQTNDCTLAVVQAGGRRKALAIWQRVNGFDSTLHYTGRKPYLLPAATRNRVFDRAVEAHETLIVDGEVRLRVEVIAERQERLV